MAAIAAFAIMLFAGLDSQYPTPSHIAVLRAWPVTHQQSTVDRVIRHSDLLLLSQRKNVRPSGAWGSSAYPMNATDQRFPRCRRRHYSPLSQPRCDSMVKAMVTLKRQRMGVRVVSTRWATRHETGLPRIS